MPDGHVRMGVGIVIYGGEQGARGKRITDLGVGCSKFLEGIAGNPVAGPPSGAPQDDLVNRLRTKRSGVVPQWRLFLVLWSSHVADCQQNRSCVSGMCDERP